LIFNVGAPIPVADYKEDYEKDPVITWAALTKLLEDRLKSTLQIPRTMRRMIFDEA
jgi:hypothetical protein